MDFSLKSIRLPLLSPEIHLLAFLDTEFTDFLNIDLISLALVTEDENNSREFYAERTDFRHEDCNDFVLVGVLPLLGAIPGAACSRVALTQRLRAWFDALPEPVTVVFDYHSDWDLLVDVLLQDGHERLPEKLEGKLHLGEATLTSDAFIDTQNFSYSYEWPRHHALADARALCSGYLAWRKSVWTQP